MLSFKEHLDIFVEGRPAMMQNNQDLLRLGILLEGEFAEFIPALLDYICNPNQETAQEMAQEAADLGLYLEQILRMVGSNLLVEMLDKLFYNSTRFYSGDFTRLPYEEAYPLSKQRAKEQGIKEDFYSVPNVIYDHETAHKTQQKYHAA
jgi:hypothetical protein